MDLKNLITSGKKVKPINMIVHGEHGIGKTTFASNSDKPIFITGEEIEEIDAAKFPKCKSWNEFVDYLSWIRDSEHDYKTLVIDTLDSIESLLWKHILIEDGSEDMARAHGGYGKGYTLATQMFTEIRDEYLSRIRDEKGMNIVLLCHTTKNKFEDPLTQTSYDVYEMKLHKTGKGVGSYTVFAEWVSIIAFAKFEVFTVKDKSSEKRYAIGEGERVMHCTTRPAYDAKNRFDFPDDMPFTWKAIVQGVKNFYNKEKVESNPEIKALREEIIVMANKIKDTKLKESTLQNIESVGNDKERLLKAKKYIIGVVNGK